VILAGGLTPENVRQAILAVKPAGVDTHTGVEDTCGKKDRDKVKRFVEQAHSAFALIHRSC
jgi:phosphoribosylanthranilate isomerase